MLIIRPATAADVPHLLPLNRIVQYWHAQHYPEVFQAQVTDADLTTFFARQIAEAFVDLALWSDAPAGYAFATLSDRAVTPLTKARKHLHLEHIATHPEHRRKGIATALIAHMEDRARALGCSELNLTSWAANADAHAAFHAAGFEKQRHWFAKPL